MAHPDIKERVIRVVREAFKHYAEEEITGSTHLDSSLRVTPEEGWELFNRLEDEFAIEINHPATYTRTIDDIVALIGTLEDAKASQKK